MFSDLSGYVKYSLAEVMGSVSKFPLQLLITLHTPAHQYQRLHKNTPVNFLKCPSNSFNQNKSIYITTLLPEKDWGLHFYVQIARSAFTVLLSSQHMQEEHVW